jgi:hypothetical protein
MMDEKFNFNQFETKLKIKLEKLGFNKKWMQTSNYVESMSSRELHDMNKTADDLLKNDKLIKHMQWVKKKNEEH